MRFHPFLFLMPDWADTQIALMYPKGRFRLGQLHISTPKLFFTPIGNIGSQQITSLTQLGPLTPCFQLLPDQLCSAIFCLDNIVKHSPAFYSQSWRKMVIKDTTRGTCVWQVKAVQVHLVKQKDDHRNCPVPTERSYWLIVAYNEKTDEIKYFVSNAPAKESHADLLEVAFSRWHVEKWFERAKQECGMGAFEVRTYTSLIRHWLASRLAMFFLATQTRRLRGEKSTDYSGTSGRRGEYADMESVGKISVFMETTERAMPILSGA